jgi:TolB protein
MARQPVRLTRDGRQKMDPVFIRGGDELVFTVLESPTQLSLMRLKLADGTVERLHPEATTAEFESSFSPDGRYYAFVQSRANLNLKLVIRDTKQNKDSIFDPGGGFAGMRKPSVAPDGSRVIFSIPAATGQTIDSVNLLGQDRKRLTQGGLNNWPAFSPDGKRIAFGSSRDGDFEIYVMDADGGNVLRLTRSPGLDARPAWSPDGKRLAFTSNRDGNYEVYVMNADGSGPRRVTDHPERDDHAAWHPDGRRLAVVSERNGHFDLYLVEVPE